MAETCIHRGRIMSGTTRCFCRHATIRRVVGLDLCDVCPLIEATGVPSPPLHAVEVRTPPTPDDVPCVHRSSEPIRNEPCKSCSNLFGLRTISVYGCAHERHVEATLMQSEVMRTDKPTKLAGWCESCKDRQPA